MTSFKEYTREDWLKSWEEGGHTLWHQNKVDTFLRKHFPDLQERLGSKDRMLQILVPFCGKTLDLHWLAEAGHKVVGVEISERAVKDFFAESNLPFEQVQAGKLVQYKCANAAKKIEIWQGDVFECSSDSVCVFDAVWDRGGLGSAVTVEDRQRYLVHWYRDLILSLLAPKGAILMHTHEYGRDDWHVTPYSISGHLLQDLWGHACSVELVEAVEKEGTDPSLAERYGFGKYNLLAHIIQKK